MAVVRRFFQEPSGHFFLFGPRGTGKSTWLQATFKRCLHIDLLAPEVQREYSARPERLRELVAGNREATVVVVDEVQKAPELLDVVHSLIETRRAPRFVLTGSSARKLKRTGVDLLAGRALLRSMHPFMAAELGRQWDLELALNQGLVPLIWDARRPADALRAYVGLYVREEVQMEGLVRNMGSFSRFLEAISFSHASVLNLADVARDCHVSRKTVEGYVSILEDLLLAFRLPVFTKRARRHLTSHPKFFWFDAGVFRSVRPAGPLDRPAEIAGPALEGLVAQHLRAWIDYSQASLDLCFWRTKSGNEVDFIVYGRSGFHAIEVMNATAVRPKDLGGLRAFKDDYPEATALLLYRGRDALEIDGIRCLPVDRFLARLVPGKPLP